MWTAHIILVVQLPCSCARATIDQSVARPFLLLTSPPAPAVLSHLLRQYEKVVLIDSRLCIAEHRATAQQFLTAWGIQHQATLTIEWRYFANDPAACWANRARMGADPGLDSMIGTLSRLYIPPDGAVLHPVVPWVPGMAPQVPP